MFFVIDGQRPILDGNALARKGNDALDEVHILAAWTVERVLEDDDLPSLGCV